MESMWFVQLFFLNGHIEWVMIQAHDFCDVEDYFLDEFPESIQDIVGECIEWMFS